MTEKAEETPTPSEFIENTQFSKTQIEEMKSRFIAAVSHEFRTPLSTILSSLSLLEQYVAPTEGTNVANHIARMRSSIHRLVEMLNDFLSLSELERGVYYNKNKQFDLNQLSREMVSEMMQLSKKGQFITFYYYGSFDIYHDSNMYKEILYNLLSNAIKFSGEYQEISLDISVDSVNVLVCVRDMGIGIPKEEQQKIPQAFFRAANAVSIAGSGIGLYMVKRYLEIVNGELSFESEQGNGASFLIKIPLIQTGIEKGKNTEPLITS